MKLVFLVTILLFKSLNIEASTSIAVPMVKYYADSNYPGKLNDFLDKFSERVQNFTPKFLPVARSVKSFAMKETDCFMGGNRKLALKMINQNVIESNHYQIRYTRVLTLKNKQIISNKRQLKNKRAVYVNGASPKHLLRIDKSQVKELIPVSSTLSAIQFILKNRADAFIVLGGIYDPNYKNLFHFDSDLYLNKYENRLLCHDTAKNKAVIKKFNRFIKDFNL